MSGPYVDLNKEVVCPVPADYPTPPGVVLPVPNPIPSYIDEAEAISQFRSYVASKCCWDHSMLDELQVLSVGKKKNDLIAVGNVFRLRHFPPKHIRSAFRRLAGNSALQCSALQTGPGRPSLSLGVPALAAALLPGEADCSGAIYRLRW